MSTVTEIIANRVHNWLEEHTFSGVIQVNSPEEMLYNEAFGFADRVNQRINRGTTKFGIASGTKMFTALSILKLIEAEKLQLDSKVSPIVPELSIHKDVTIEQLLNHTSGVYDYLDEEQIEDFDSFELPIAPYKLRSCHDYMPMLQGEMKYSPGERFAYNNSGYIILGIIIENLTEKTYQEHVNQSLFSAIGMENSGFYSFDNLPEDTALGYVTEEQGGGTNIYRLPIIGGADGGAYTTAGDMLLFWKALQNGEIISPTLLHMLFSEKTLCEENSYYNCGMWSWREESARPIYYLDGWDAGVAFQSKLLPDGAIITLLANTGDEIWPLAVEIEEAIESINDNSPESQSDSQQILQAQ